MSIKEHGSHQRVFKREQYSNSSRPLFSLAQINSSFFCFRAGVLFALNHLLFCSPITNHIWRATVLKRLQVVTAHYTTCTRTRTEEISLTEKVLVSCLSGRVREALIKDIGVTSALLKIQIRMFLFQTPATRNTDISTTQGKVERFQRKPIITTDAGSIYEVRTASGTLWKQSKWQQIRTAVIVNMIKLARLNNESKDLLC